MSQTDAVSAIVFKWQTDRASINKTTNELNTRFKQVQRNADGARKGILTMTDAARGLDKQLNLINRERAFDALTADVQKSIRHGQNLNDVLARTSTLLARVGATEPEIRRVARAIDEAQRDASSTLARVQGFTSGGGIPGRGIGGFGRVGSGNQKFGPIGRFGSELRNLPDVGPSTDIANVMRVLDVAFTRSGASAAQLATSLGLVGVAITGVLVFLAKFNEQIEAVKRTLTAALSAQEVFFEARTSMTSDEVRAEVERLSIRNQGVLQPQIDETQAAIDSAWQQLVAQFGDSGARALEAGGLTPLTALRERLAELQTEFDANEHAVVRLNQGLAEGAFAYQDIIAAQTQAVEVALAAMQAQISKEQEFVRLRLTGSSEAVQQQIQENNALATSLEQHLIANNQLQAEYGLTDEALELLVDDYRETWQQIQDLRTENERLVESVLPIIELREREAELAEQLTQQNDEYLESLQGEVDIRNEMTEAQREMADALAETQAKLADIRQQLQEKFADAEEKRLESIADLEDKLGEERVKLAEAARDRLAKLERDFNRTRLNAIGERDALALFQAKQKFDDELADQKESDDKKLREIEKSGEKQLQAIQKRYAKELETAQRAADRAIAQENARWNAELQQRQQAYIALQTQLQNFVNAQIAIAQQLASMQGGYSGGAYGGWAGTPGTPVTVPLPGGGSQPGWSVPVTPIYPGQPGYVNQYSQPAALNQGGGGGFTANFNVQGMTPAQVRREVDASREELVRVMFGGRTVAA